MAELTGLVINHIARESTNVKRLANFYIQVFGCEQVESPNFGCEVVWLKLGSSLRIHIIEKDPDSKLPESPYSATPDAVAQLTHLPRAHHVCFYTPNFDSFVQSLKEKGIAVHEKTLPPDGKIRQAFFFDPDGNGLEVSNHVECCQQSPYNVTTPK